MMVVVLMIVVLLKAADVRVRLAQLGPLSSVCCVEASAARISLA
jgi:hypothetical protein